MDARVRIRDLWLCAAAVVVCGCGEEDLTSVRFTVRADGSGSVVVAALRVESGERDPLRPTTKGIGWETRRAAVVMQKGSFRDVSRVEIAGMSAALSPGDKGGHIFRLTVPLGEGAKWPGLIAAVGDDRAFIRDICRAETDLPRLGREPSFKFTVTMPGPVTEHRCTPDITAGASKSGGLFSFGGGGGGETGSSDNRAYLVIPMAEVRRQKGKELIWEVTCKEE